jgi:hypothetical protein
MLPKWPRLSAVAVRRESEPPSANLGKRFGVARMSPTEHRRADLKDGRSGPHKDHVVVHGVHRRQSARTDSHTGLTEGIVSDMRVFAPSRECPRVLATRVPQRKAGVGRQRYSASE